MLGLLMLGGCSTMSEYAASQYDACRGLKQKPDSYEICMVAAENNIERRRESLDAMKIGFDAMAGYGQAQANYYQNQNQQLLNNSINSNYSTMPETYRVQPIITNNGASNEGFYIYGQ